MIITVDQLWQELRYGTEGKFFSVEFERRTNSQRRVQVAGDIRKMLCRTQMHSYKKGIISDRHRDEQDFRCGILTVWSMDSYMLSRRHGTTHEVSAMDAWRRIDLAGVRKCSLFHNEEISMRIHSELHEITNTWRLANMPLEA